MITMETQQSFPSVRFSRPTPLISASVCVGGWLLMRTVAVGGVEQKLWMRLKKGGEFLFASGRSDSCTVSWSGAELKLFPENWCKKTKQKNNTKETEKQVSIPAASLRVEATRWGCKAIKVHQAWPIGPAIVSKSVFSVKLKCLF